MREAGVIGPDDNPNIEQMKRLDESRKSKKVSNDEWQSTVDPDSRITKIKDGTTNGYGGPHCLDQKTDFIRETGNASFSPSRVGPPSPSSPGIGTGYDDLPPIQVPWCRIAQTLMQSFSIEERQV